ncbi:MAG TPA: lantibiotic dehydratase [Hanamia sp.]|nr:lantibiotic dehydratase [Hanamia sp.]
MPSICNYKFYPELMLRTPAYSYKTYNNQIHDILNDPYFRSAIYLASKSLFDVLEKKNFDHALLSEREQISLRMYFNRMCFRPTPFALFSAFSSISWESENRELVLSNTRKVHVQLDNGFLSELITKGKPDITQKYVLNKSLYKAGNEYRYLRYGQNNENGKRDFWIDSIELTHEIKDVLSFCAKYRTRTQLINFISELFEEDVDECRSFLEELIEMQILLPELLPNITGEDYLDRTLNNQEFGNTKILTQLNEIKNMIIGLNESHHALLPENIIKTNREIRQLTNSEDSNKSPMYVNTEMLCIKGGLPQNLQTKILDGLFCIDKLSPNQQQSNALSKFVSAYKQKFDQRWIPLMTALDPEIGVGYESLAENYYSSPLIKNIQLSYCNNTKQKIEWTSSHALLLNKWNALQTANGDIPTITLDNADLKNLSDQQTNLHFPPGISVIFRKAGESVYIEQAGGATATALPGRFTPLNSNVRETVQSIARIEATLNQDIIFAEIVHVCDPDLMNIERRDVVRQYEIPILTASTVPEKDQIPLNDLWISVPGNEIILWSRRLKKRIIPRLTSAFNYLRSDLPVFRLLCDLQYQGIKANFSFDLSNFFPGLAFYPRVQYKGAILNLASWHIRQDSLNEISRNHNVEENLLAITKFAKSMKWPRYISLNRHDHYIVIDSQNDEDLVFLTKILKKEESVVIKEFPFIEEGNQMVRDSSHNPYISQFITSLYHEQKIYDAIGPEFDQSIAVRPIERKFLPGSIWSYFKIYCHPLRANDLLLNHIIPLCNRWVTAGFVNQWFFIRYNDPEFHIRIRFDIDPIHSGIIIKGLNNILTPLIIVGLVSNLQTAVYERELERYDSGIIELIENSFCISSSLITTFFKNTVRIKDSYYLYEMAYCSLDILLDAFCYKEEDKIKLFNHFYINLRSEFHITELIEDQLRRKFREIRQVTGILQSKPIINKFNLGIEISQFKFIHEQIAELTSDWHSDKERKLVADLIHMHLNRLFPEASKKNELIVYYSLWRQYESDQGRERKKLRHSLTTD